MKSIGKAVSKGTQQIGKTLTNLADSPDKRAQERLAKINTPQFYDRSARKGNLKDVGQSLDDGDLGMDAGESLESLCLCSAQASSSTLTLWNLIIRHKWEEGLW